jgi:hypothetical protein
MLFMDCKDHGVAMEENAEKLNRLTDELLGALTFTS